MYLKKVLLGFLLSFYLFILLLSLHTGSPRTRWIDEIYHIKLTYVQSVKTEKIIILSGSNGIFGISCEQIYEENNIPCINGSTHAGLGVKYILHKGKLWLKSRDIVILPLEYSFYSNSQNSSNVLVDYVVAKDRKYLTQFTWLEKTRFILGLSWNDLFLGIEAKLRLTKPRQSHYNSKNLNQYGDETSNQKEAMTDKQKKAIAQLKPVDEIADYLKDTKGMKSIENFINYCRENNIQVVAMWPSFLWFDVYDKTKQAEVQSIQDFYDNLAIPVLGKPDDFRDKNLFYDTNYHLNDEGKKIRTTQLITSLEQYLDFPSF